MVVRDQQRRKRTRLRLGSEWAASARHILDAAAQVLQRGTVMQAFGLTVCRRRGRDPGAGYLLLLRSRDQLIEEVMSAESPICASMSPAPWPSCRTARRRWTGYSSRLKPTFAIALEISHTRTASMQPGQPQTIRKRRSSKRNGTAISGVGSSMTLRARAFYAGIDLYVAANARAGRMNWTVEWWDARRGSVRASSPTRVSLFGTASPPQTRDWARGVVDCPTIWKRVSATRTGTFIIGA